MIPILSKPRKDGLSSFHRLASYLIYERVEGTVPSLQKQRGTVVFAECILDPERAATEMADAAADNERVKEPAMHFELAWRPGEKPDRDEWVDSAERAIAALGFSEHQYMIVAHTDKPHFHVHVMLNRVHPESGRAHNPRLSQVALHKVARELEHDYGRQETAGLYRWDNDAQKPVRVPKAEVKERRQDAERPRGGEVQLRGRMEHFNDSESVRSFVADEPARALRQLLNKKPSWEDVHQLFDKHGLELHAAEKGGYTVNVIGSSLKVKASDVLRFAFSGKQERDKLHAILGPYQPMRHPTGEPLTVPYDDSASTQPGRPSTQPERHSTRQPLVVRYDAAPAASGQLSSRQPLAVDYTRTTPEENKRNDTYLRQSTPVSTRTGTPPESLHNMRSVSERAVVRDLNIPRMFLQRDEAEHFRIERPDQHRRLRRREAGEPEKAPDSGRGGRDRRHPLHGGDTTVDLAARRSSQRQHEDAEAAVRYASKLRREKRLEERRQQRAALKAEFNAARVQHRKQLHDFTLEAGRRRAALRSEFARDKQIIRATSTTWQQRQIRLSHRVLEQLIDRQELNLQLSIGRGSITRVSYQEWIEQRVAAGDSRAVAQLRGWKYQDQRNIRKSDTQLEDEKKRAAGRMGPDPADRPAGKRHDVDWEFIANDRLRELRKQKSIPALSSVRMSVNSTTGDATYTLAGVVSLVDRGRLISVLPHDLDATRIALEMAVQKYGRVIDAKGTTAWRGLLVQAVLQQKLDVLFTDPALQAALEAARQRAKEAERARQEAARQRAQKVDSAFQWEAAQMMNRYGPGMGAEDMDTMIAKGLARKGYSVEEIAGALLRHSRKQEEQGYRVSEEYCSKIANRASQLQKSRQSSQAIDSGMER